jgi:hypothetical protein
VVLDLFNKAFEDVLDAIDLFYKLDRPIENSFKDKVRQMIDSGIKNQSDKLNIESKKI